ncbi:hypothetical protein [Bacillus tropicus]
MGVITEAEFNAKKSSY